MYLYRDYDHCIGHVKSWCFVSVSSWLQQCNTWAQFLFIIVIPPRLPATSVIKLPCSGPSQLSVLHLALGSFTSRNIARYWLIIAIFAYPTCFRRPVGGRGSRLLFGVEKLEWFGYPTEKKNWRYVYSFWQNSRTWRTHWQTDSIGRAHIVSRGNKKDVTYWSLHLSDQINFASCKLNIWPPTTHGNRTKGQCKLTTFIEMTDRHGVTKNKRQFSSFCT